MLLAVDTASQRTDKIYVLTVAIAVRRGGVNKMRRTSEEVHSPYCIRRRLLSTEREET